LKTPRLRSKQCRKHNAHYQILRHTSVYSMPSAVV
jgi:hypothetical protein